MTTIVTGIYGAIDTLKQPCPQSVPCEWMLVTNDRHLSALAYDEVVWDLPDGRHPRLQSKEPKLRPWNYAKGSGPWIWIDGSMQVSSPHFVRDVLAASFGNPLAQWAHPDRTCIYPEADLSATLPKYADTPVLDQVEHYARIGHPPDWGLWAAGLIVYNQPLPYLADLWWAEINQWGYQDQLSEPVALRAAGLRPKDLPYDLRDNPWIGLHPHLSEL